jgi:hypothetical protein
MEDGMRQVPIGWRDDCLHAARIHEPSEDQSSGTTTVSGGRLNSCSAPPPAEMIAMALATGAALVPTFRRMEASFVPSRDHRGLVRVAPDPEASSRSPSPEADRCHSSCRPPRTVR